MTGIAIHLILAPLLAATARWTGPGTDPAPDPVPVAGVWPLAPRPDVVEGFAPAAEQWGSGHRGVDLLGRPGQTVRAARAGTVSFAGMLAGRGVVVVVHGATRTTYEPVDALVTVGDRVRAGDPIGSLGSFASHCWPRSCLHWGLLEGETYLDPLTLVGAGPVRLLPLFSALPPGASSSAPQGLVGALPRFVTPAGGPAGRPAAAGPW